MVASHVYFTDEMRQSQNILQEKCYFTYLMYAVKRPYLLYKNNLSQVSDVF